MSALTFIREINKGKAFFKEHLSSMVFNELEKEAYNELMVKIWGMICEDFGRPNSPKVEEHIKKVIYQASNIYITDDMNNYDETISYILQDCSGYLGRNLNDDEFENMREYVNAHLAFGDYYNILEYMLEGRPLSHTDTFKYINDFRNHFPKYDIEYLVNGKKAENMAEPMKVEKPYSEVMAILNIKGNKYNLVYNIINTDEYDAGMGSTIVSCNCPQALTEWGFDDNEIDEIAEIGIGDVFYSHAYGKTAMVVRMA